MWDLIPKFHDCGIKFNEHQMCYTQGLFFTSNCLKVSKTLHVFLLAVIIEILCLIKLKTDLIINILLYKK